MDVKRVPGFVLLVSKREKEERNPSSSDCVLCLFCLCDTTTWTSNNVGAIVSFRSPKLTTFTLTTLQVLELCDQDLDRALQEHMLLPETKVGCA
jgi:hypothetical protein